MLLLSSMDFNNSNSKRIILENLPKDIKECRILFFPNERFSRESMEKKIYREILMRAGFAKRNIFVFDYDYPEGFDELEPDCVFIGGGNTFKTFEKIRAVGADKLIKDYVLNKGATFIGGSAGAHIASSNIEHVKNFDELPDGFSDFEGLGLFDGILFCHYSPLRAPYALEAEKEGKYKVYRLTDDDCLIIK